MAVLGSGRDLNGRGAPVGSIWSEFQLKRSHGDPFRDRNRGFVIFFHGTDQLPLRSDQLLLGTDQWTIDYLVETCDYMVEASDYLVETSDHLVVTSDYLVVTSVLGSDH